MVDRGAKTPRGTVFELELAGQRLALPSKAELRVGARYELEKISATEFRILREIAEDKKPGETEIAATKPQTAPRLSDGAQYLSAQPAAGSADLLAVKLIADEGGISPAGNNKYAFDLSREFPLQGVFVARSPGKYTLFIAVTAADAHAIAHFQQALKEFGVEVIRQVTADVLERIAQGSIDMKT